MTNYATMSVRTLSLVQGFARQVTYQYRPMLGGYQMIADFHNGYSVSVVSHRFSYGGDAGLWEGAVLHDGSIVYDTPVTDDVVGCMTEVDVLEFCHNVADLPVR